MRARVVALSHYDKVQIRAALQQRAMQFGRPGANLVLNFVCGCADGATIKFDGRCARASGCVLRANNNKPWKSPHQTGCRVKRDANA